jgi:protein-tyrosine phosphatase
MNNAQDSMPALKVLFVCTGNICRSPTAEAVMRGMLNSERLQDRVLVGSAGTHDYHVGEKPDRRSVAAAARRGYDLTVIRARQVSPQDLHDCDYVLAMDRGHLAQLRSLARAEFRVELQLFLDYSTARPGGDVPDPYYGGEQGFEAVLDLIEDGARGVLADIKKRLGI